MDNDTIQDLKQFIAAMFSQERTSLRADIRADTREDLHVLDTNLSSKIDDMSAAIAAVFELNNEDVDGRLQNHEKRITRLEPMPAL